MEFRNGTLTENAEILRQAITAVRNGETAEFLSSCAVIGRSLRRGTTTCTSRAAGLEAKGPAARDPLGANGFSTGSHLQTFCRVESERAFFARLGASHVRPCSFNPA